jgi:hypothetical protein
VKIKFLPALILLFATSAFSQGLSPLVSVLHADKHGHATGTLQAVNQTLMPIAVTLELKGFTLDETGHMTATELDTTKVRVALDSTSARVPPQSNHTFAVSVDVTEPAAFYILSCNGQARHQDNGVQVKTCVAETVYVVMEPLRKTDVTAAWTDAHTLLVTNTSEHAGRAEYNTAGKAQLPDFTLMPHASRILHVDESTQGATLRFEKFTLKTAGQ